MVSLIVVDMHTCDFTRPETMLRCSVRRAIVTSIGMAMQEAANEGCKSSECMWSYGIGDLGGEIYLTSGTLPDWAHWAFGAASFTVELPPRTQAQGGFSPSENLV